MPKCPNRKKNKRDCPCPELDCPRRGICCECIRFHLNSRTWPKPACWK